MASKIRKKEWFALYVITGAIDAFQILIDLFFTEFIAAPEVVNEFIDGVVGVGLAGYFQFLRGVSLINHPSRLLSLLGMEVLTDVTGGAASFWVLDVWYIHKTVKQEDAEELASKEVNEFTQSAIRQPFYGGGVGKPRPDMGQEPITGHIAPAPSRMNRHPAPPKMLNFNGVRRPGQ
jgi:hypothetical protein